MDIACVRLIKDKDDLQIYTDLEPATKIAIKDGDNYIVKDSNTMTPEEFKENSMYVQVPVPDNRQTVMSPHVVDNSADDDNNDNDDNDDNTDDNDDNTDNTDNNDPDNNDNTDNNDADNNDNDDNTDADSDNNDNDDNTAADGTDAKEKLKEEFSPNEQTKLAGIQTENPTFVPPVATDAIKTGGQVAKLNRRAGGNKKHSKTAKRGRKSTRKGRKSSKKGGKSHKKGRRGKGSRRSKK